MEFCIRAKDTKEWNWKEQSLSEAILEAKELLRTSATSTLDYIKVFCRVQGRWWVVGTAFFKAPGTEEQRIEWKYKRTPAYGRAVLPLGMRSIRAYGVDKQARKGIS